MTKKSGLFLLFILLVTLIFAKNYDINLPSNLNRTEIFRNDYDQLNVRFSFDGINHVDVKTQKGIFSKLIIDNAYPNGEIGNPELPAAKKLIEIPFGAEVSVRITDYDVSEYLLSDYGIDNPLMPLQPSIRKDQDVNEIEFMLNESAYQNDVFLRNQIADVKILGTLRGMRLARLVVSPLEYNPITKVLKVYNNINVEVNFSHSDIARTEYIKKATASPFFRPVYNKILNNRDRDSYDDHPDLVKYPVKYLIVADRMFEEALYPFIDWKTKRGFNVIVAYTDDIGNGYNEIQSWLQEQYNSGTPEDPAPSFFLFVGDTPQIPASMGSATNRQTDLYYGSVDGDYFPEMYYGRLSATSVEELTPQINKILYYEKYEFEDPSYLDNVTLIAGQDGTWNHNVGQPTVQYGTENYFNAAHGFDQVHEYLNSYTGCYDTVDQGVGFINYTAHGSETSWAGPGLNQSTVSNFSNVNQPTFAIGNCCLSGDFGYGECFGETWLRSDNAGVGYIGSSPSSYWFEDFYWAVGAFPISGNNDGYVPTFEETSWGTYDGPFVTDYNVMDATVFIGNLAVTEVDAQGYPQHSTPLYYWQAYNLLGDPSVLPYFTQGDINNVSYMDILPIGVTTFEVSAEEGSYVAISFNGELKGAAVVGNSGSVSVPITAITDAGLADIVVTKAQYQPYIAQVQVAPLEGPFVTVHDVYITAGDDDVIEFGEDVSLEVVLKNVGIQTATGVNATLSINDPYITITDGTENIGTIAPDQVLNFDDAFSFTVANDIPDDHAIHFAVTFTGNEGTWNNSINLTGYAAVLSISNVSVDDGSNNLLDPGDHAHIYITVHNDGGAKAHNLASVVTAIGDLITFTDNSDNVALILPENDGVFGAELDVSDAAETGEVVEFLLSLAGDNELNYDENFSLSIGLIIEDFESGDFSQYPWEFDGITDWTISNDAYEGVYCAQSDDINDNQFTTMKVQLYVTQDDEIRFYKKVSSESNYDFLKFYIDNDEEIGSWTGEVDWSQEVFAVSEGNHYFKWEYSKDGSVSSGTDCAWIDDIIFPPSIIPQAAELIYDPDNFYQSLSPNTTATQELVLSNGGDVPLTYSIAIQNTTGKDATKNLSGSNVICSSTDGFYPGDTMTLTFEVTCASDDNEWIKDLWIQFPSGVNVNSSTDLVGGESDIPSDGCIGDGAIVHWGGSGYMSNGQVATTDVEVSISSSFNGDIVLPWTLHGDEWGNDPHEITGEITLVSQGEPMTWLSIDVTSGTLNSGVSNTITLTFDSNDIDSGTYTANLIITHSAGDPITIPVTLDVTTENSQNIIPAVTRLRNNYPNPFNPETTINYDLKTDANVSLIIYNIKGQKVKTLINEDIRAGSHQIVWTGKDDNGQKAGSGVYFARFSASNAEERFTATKKMILMK